MPEKRSPSNGRHNRRTASGRQRPLDYGRRLHHPSQYRRFFEGSEVLRFTECTVFRIQNDLGHFRLGITLKARGLSVERNRVKRQIREIFRNLGPKLGSFDYNVVIPARKKMAHPYPERLAAELREDLPNKLEKLDRGVPDAKATKVPVRK